MVLVMDNNLKMYHSMLDNNHLLILMQNRSDRQYMQHLVAVSYVWLPYYALVVVDNIAVVVVLHHLDERIYDPLEQQQPCDWNSNILLILIHSIRPEWEIYDHTFLYTACVISWLC